MCVRYLVPELGGVAEPQVATQLEHLSHYSTTQRQRVIIYIYTYTQLERM